MTFPLLAEWLPANSELERPQLILSTVSADGGADARTVLLTEFDDDGLYFHTDSRSRKVRDIAANPHVAMTFLWPGFTRQLVVQGVASIAPAGEQLAAFHNRSPYLKQLAWLNSPSFAQLPLEQRRAEWAAFPMAEHPDPPATWIGFVVRPTRLTFWESNAEAASRREEYRPLNGEWVLAHLPGRLAARLRPGLPAAARRPRRVADPRTANPSPRRREPGCRRRGSRDCARMRKSFPNRSRLTGHCPVNVQDIVLSTCRTLSCYVGTK